MDLSEYLHPDMIARIQAWWYALMLILMIIEWPIVVFIAWFLASLGVFDIWIVLMFGWIGDILGDLLFYSIGRFGFQIFKKQTTIDTKAEIWFVGKLDYLIHQNLALAILIVKFTPYAPPIGLTYFGKVQVDFRKYLLYSLILCVPIPFVSGMVGFNIGFMNTLINQYSWMTLFVFLMGSIALILFSVWWFLFIKSKSKKILGKVTTIVSENEKNTRVDE